MELEEFQANCNKGFCLRKTFRNDKCKSEEKQERCFYKWERQQDKKKEKDAYKKELKRKEMQDKIDRNEFDIDHSWEDTKEEVWKRDAGEYTGVSRRFNWMQYCKIWKSFTREEQQYVIETYQAELFLNQNLDVCHIIPKSIDKSKYYDLENLVLGGRMFHTLLDRNRHPVYRHIISSEERIKILEDAKNS